MIETAKNWIVKNDVIFLVLSIEFTKYTYIMMPHCNVASQTEDCL